MWFSVVCTLIDNEYMSITVVKILWTHKAQLSESTTNLTTVMMCIVVDKSTDNTKTTFNLFFTTISMSKKLLFSRAPAEKGIV